MGIDRIDKIEENNVNKIRNVKEITTERINMEELENLTALTIPYRVIKRSMEDGIFVPGPILVLPIGSIIYQLDETGKYVSNWIVNQYLVQNHGIIEITTGIEEKRTVRILLCPKNPVSRDFLYLLRQINADTLNLKDTRLIFTVTMENKVINRSGKTEIYDSILMTLDPVVLMLENVWKHYTDCNLKHFGKEDF